MRQRFYLTTACLFSTLACVTPPTEGPAGGGTVGSTGGSKATGGASAGTVGSGAGGASASGTGGSATSSGGAGGGSSSGGSTGATGGSSGATGGAGGGAVDAPIEAAGGNAGGQDASGETAPPASGGFDCTAAGAKFCNDFEGFPAGQAPMGKWTKSGTVVVDTAQAFSGKQSLKFSGPRGSFTSQLTFGSDFLPVGGTEFHGRFMVYFTDIPNKTNGGNGCHFDLAIASGAGGTYILGGMYGNFMGVYHPGDCSKDSDQPVPTKKWACVQWEFSGEPNKSHVFRMLINGKVMPNGEVTDSGPANCGQSAARRWQPPPAFTSLKFGWVNYQSTPIPIEMWVDDFAFGPKPIPCPAALP